MIFHHPLITFWTKKIFSKKQIIFLLDIPNMVNFGLFLCYNNCDFVLTF